MSDEKISKLKEKRKEYKDKGDKLQGKANEYFSKVKELDKKIEELENEKTIGVAKLIYEKGLTLDDINEALANGDLSILEKKLRESKGEESKAETDKEDSGEVTGNTNQAENEGNVPYGYNQQ